MNEEAYCLPLLENLRRAGIPSEIYPSDDKMKKQMNYANRKGVKYVILAGESEIAEGIVTVKNMDSGEQIRVETSELTSYFQKAIESK
jgi:histidyl-tRNA synthetase